MGAATSSSPFHTLTRFFCIFTTTLTLLTPFIHGDDTVATSSRPNVSTTEPFKYSTGVIIGALVTTSSITLLFFLYIKHCADARTFAATAANSQPSHVRKNSGVDHALLDSLPVFQFGSLKGQGVIDCAVCLAVFEDSEALRLLPKCRHAFHVECVDAWLHAHSTCPLCRYKVEPDEVVVLVEEDAKKAKSAEGESSQNDAALRGENENAGTASLDTAERGLGRRFVGVQQRLSDFEARDALRLTSETATWEARGERGRRSHSCGNSVGEVMENDMMNLRGRRSFHGLLQFC
ncbi:RING-H2 finger protein ATL17-like [Vigna unguiculata]|uniref:RING-type E3 ubiquitin transferase n=1 Tax=Vigna unguiculata TaxID=3917 RepID=A0A4D6MH38_VIGUN|nr:RING-H2 finger protein ATL17-like [Vigna unguiculata]QCE00726.1 nucleolysin TIA-1/TIAR [Vigna unguiculata]